MRKYLTIGEVAKGLNINVSKIRHYEREGLIEPSIIDDNLYRLYDHDKIDQLENLLLLRDLNIPMVEIKALIQNYSVENYLDKLNKSKINIDKEIEELKKKRDKVNEKIDMISHLSEDETRFEIVSIGKRNLYEVFKCPSRIMYIKEKYDLISNLKWFDLSKLSSLYTVYFEDNTMGCFVDERALNMCDSHIIVHEVKEGRYLTLNRYLKTSKDAESETDLTLLEQESTKEAIKELEEYMVENKLKARGPLMLKYNMRGTYDRIYCTNITFEVLISE